MKVNILVIDDEIAIRETFEEVLTDQGYNVHTAANSDEAIKLVSQHNYQVMLIDLYLNEEYPDSLNGIDLCRVLRSINPIAIKIAVTGHQTLFQLTDSRDAGFDDYFIKPVKLETLYESIKLNIAKMNRWLDKNYE